MCEIISLRRFQVEGVNHDKNINEMTIRYQ